jgi:hypothetical protein
MKSGEAAVFNVRDRDDLVAKYICPASNDGRRFPLC